ncbi:MFS transporter [Paracoccus marcusii]|uniref:MFS transporter n=1 Tax=Paracoccus marcusii TaxID=59779 RepID=UPI002ED04C21|nr:MFS transporter [Paracoccus marcusii]
MGGEWGGAVLLATENAPEGKRSWYGMFPQLGAPVGLLLSSGSSGCCCTSSPRTSCWPGAGGCHSCRRSCWSGSACGSACPSPRPRIRRGREEGQARIRPLAELFRHHKLSVFLGTFAALATFVLFYLATAWLLSYNVKVLGIPFKDALLIQIYGSVVFGLTIPFAGKIADRTGRYGFLIIVTILIGALPCPSGR